MTIRTHLNLSTIVLTLIFVAWFFLFESHDRRTDEISLEHHARVIKNSLWNLDSSGPVEYLTLATAAGNYADLRVIDLNGREFIHIEGRSPSPSESLLGKLGLIPQVLHRVPIVREGRTIGHLAVLHRHDSIYYHLYVLLILILFLVAYTLLMRILQAKRNLESRVASRTAELAEAMAAAQESEEKFRAFSEQAVVGVLARQGDRFIYSNQAAADILGHDVGDILRWRGSDCLDKLACDEDKQLLMEQVTGDSACSWRATAQDGEIRWIDSISRTIKFHGQKAILITLTDITSRKRIEEELRQREKMDSIGQLAGGVAHDFNNMLGGIIGAAEILTTRLPDNDPNRTFIDMIIDTSCRAADLTSKLLAFSRKGRILSREFNVHDCIRDAYMLLERTIDKRITIKPELNAEQQTIVGDPSQVQNAILNLAVNARDAMPDGGEITFTTTNITLDKAYCVASPFDLQVGDYLQVSIHDSGMGIPPELQQKVFEPFFTTKEVGKGTGLGLAAVYGTIKDHHGAIAIYSELDVGTVFHLYFPLANSASKPISQQEEDTRTGAGTILVVDDEEVIRNTANVMLDELGYTVLLAVDGEHGVELFREYQDEVKAILLDMVMPKMDGTQCFDRIRAVSPNVPIVLCSGFTGSASIESLLERGANAFIKKPYRMSELSSALAEASTQNS